jgi:hypothetical protein
MVLVSLPEGAAMTGREIFFAALATALGLYLLFCWSRG